MKENNLASIVKYEGNIDTLVWKYPEEDFNIGSQLIVHESQEAIFFRNGQALDLFGPGRYTLETQKLPLLNDLYKLPADTSRTFHSEVYFINKSTQMGIKWGTDSKVRLFDPASGLHLEIGACGECNIRVANSRKLLLKLVGTTDGLGRDQIIGSGTQKGYFRTLVITEVKSYLAQVIKERQISILEIDSYLLELSEALQDKINVYMEKYGLCLSEFYISSIVTPDDDPNFRRFRQQYAEQYLLVRQEQIRKSEAEAMARRKEVEAQTAMRLKLLNAQAEADALRLRKQAEADAYKMKAEAEAMEMRMKGYTYQQETARQVGLEAMQNGLTGHGNSGGEVTGTLGDLAGVGVSLGALGSVMGMAKDAMNPMMEMTQQAMQPLQMPTQSAEPSQPVPPPQTQSAQEQPASPVPDFQTAPVTEPEKETWNCICGAKGNHSMFCPDCGRKKGATE